MVALKKWSCLPEPLSDAIVGNKMMAQKIFTRRSNSLLCLILPGLIDKLWRIFFISPPPHGIVFFPFTGGLLLLLQG